LLSAIFRLRWETVELSEQNKQGVALTGRNRTGPPCGVGHPTVHASSPAAAHRPRAGGRPAGPSAALQTMTDDDRR